MTMMIIHIKFNSPHSFPVEVSPRGNIRQLKEAVSSQQNVKPEELRIIFQGLELKDAASIHEYDFSENTVLHVVKGKRKVPATSALSGLNAIAEIAGPSGDSGASKSNAGQAQFYVCCKNICKTVQVGKLRVRCAKCLQDTLELDREPARWEDVLVSNQISGVCQNEDCDGKVADFYFRCAGHSGQENGTAVALTHLKSNSRDVPCITCMHVETPVLVFPCEAGHVMCLDCFSLYCVSRLNERAFVQHNEWGYTLPCPAACENSFIQEAHHFRVIGDDQYCRYQRFGAEECVLDSGGLLCPTPGCSAGLLPCSGAQRIECEKTSLQGCGAVFCRLCLRDYHGEEPCTHSLMPSAGGDAVGYELDPRRAQKARWEAESLRTIQDTTKPCPQCKAPTERNEGCMHMTCSKCKADWCWLCVKPWSVDCVESHWFQ